MDKLLTPEAARNVFSPLHKEEHGLQKKGGMSYISSASMEEADAQRSAVASLLAAKGNKCWSEMLTYCPEGELMMKNANKELLSGNRIAGAEMIAVSPELAGKMVEKAEQQIANNKMMEKMAINNQAITR